MNYLLGLPEEALRERSQDHRIRFRVVWHHSLVMECMLPGLVGKTFT